MKFFVLAVRDRALDAFMQPFFVQSIGLGVRSFSDEVNRNSPDSPIFKHPEDFDLYEIGEYDDHEGSLISVPPRQIAVGKDVRRPGEGVSGA